MIKFAITGNIASGKSEVEKIINTLGYKVFDADKIAHEILYKSDDVINCFQDYDISENNRISRTKLGNIVFSNSELRKKLEDIIHPQVKKEIQNIFQKYKDDKYVFISMPLLFESNMQNLFDKIIFIYCDDNIRLERLMKRNNLSKEQAKNRIDSQWKQDTKKELADYIIINESSINNLKQQITDIF